MRRIQTKIDELEEWTSRLHQTAIQVMFFTPMPADIHTTRDELMRNSEVIDRVRRIREAVTQNLSERPAPLTSLLLDNTEDVSSMKLLHERKEDSSLYILEGSSMGTTVLEWRTYSDDISQSELNKVRKTVRDVASTLNHVDPESMGILHCRGFKHVADENRFELHFLLPSSCSARGARSLRHILRTALNKPIRHSLQQRVSIAKKLAAAVYYVHAGDFVHKNIRPDNIVVLDPAIPENVDKSRARYFQYPRVLGQPFLVGYYGVRKADARSSRAAVNDPNKAIYLSPDRASDVVERDFDTKDDVYSVGIVLLELALWTDFSNYEAPFAGALWHNQTLRSSENCHKRMIELANKEVPSVLGPKYADAIVACLTGMREEDDAGELKDADQVHIGTAYITQVMKRLEEIVL